MLRVILFCVILIVLSANGKERPEDLRKVHLEGLGNVLGMKFWDGEFYEFFGIPYATMPKGRDRYKNEKLKMDKEITKWIPREDKRKRGRPNRRWEDVFTQTQGTEWMRIARDRKLWQELGEAYAKEATSVHETHDKH